MLKLSYHELNFEKTFEYFANNLTNTNALSSILMKQLDFKNGRFFTFLPDEVDLKKIHNFQWGGLAGQKRELRDFISNKLKSNNQLSCLFDDFSSTYTPGYNEPLFLSCGLVYEQEIYYFITQEMATSNVLGDCFYASDAIWHSLCLLTEYDFSHKEGRQLSIEDILQISLHTVFMAVGAYDDEGYVFWEKQKSSSLDFPNELRKELLIKVNEKTSREQGSWVKERGTLRETLHPDFNNPGTKGPHWDYVGPDYPLGARLFLDGTWEAK